MLLSVACAGNPADSALEPGGDTDDIASVADARELATDQGRVHRLVLRGEGVYWIKGGDEPSIGRHTWDSTRRSNNFRAGAAPAYLVADQTYLYLLDSAENSISRQARFESGDPEDLVILGGEAADAPVEMAIDGTKLYFIGADYGIYEMDRRRGATRRQVAALDEGAHDLLASNGRLYYLKGKHVEMIDLTVGDEPDDIAYSPELPDRLVADSDYVYYSTLMGIWRVASSGDTYGQDFPLVKFGEGNESFALVGDLAVVGEHVYAAVHDVDSYRIIRMSRRRAHSEDREGGAGIETVVELESPALALASDGDFVYWSDEAGSVYQLQLRTAAD